MTAIRKTNIKGRTNPSKRGSDRCRASLRQRTRTAASTATRTTEKAGELVPASRDKHQLILTERPGMSHDRQVAEIGLSAVVGNACTARAFGRGTFGEVDLTDTVAVMTEHASRVQRGDLSEVEATLVAQSASLNAVFNELARRASLNMGEHLTATETYLRLAFEAQAQCRATLETLAEIKNPTHTSFVKQANVAIGGPQQVNNEQAAHGGSSGTPAGPARAANSDCEANRLLGATDGARLDGATQGTAGAADSHVETVGVIDGAAH